MKNLGWKHGGIRTLSEEVLFLSSTSASLHPGNVCSCNLKILLSKLRAVLSQFLHQGSSRAGSGPRPYLQPALHTSDDKEPDVDQENLMLILGA